MEGCATGLQELNVVIVLQRERLNRGERTSSLPGRRLNVSQQPARRGIPA